MKKFTPVSLSTLGIALAMFAGEVLASDCRIGWHPQGKGLLAVYKDDQPYKGRAYIVHDDVLQLRKFLVSSGDCVQAARREACSIRRTDTGAFQIHFGPRPLYSNESHQTQRVADDRMRDLVKIGFCTSAPAVPTAMTASTGQASTGQARKLKIIAK